MRVALPDHPEPVAASLAAFEAALPEVPPAEVPAVIGELERLKATCWARLSAAQQHPAVEPRQSEQGPLTQDEAAQLYRIPLRKVRFLTRTGCVPSYQQGRNRMIRPVDLDRYLTRCRDQGVKVGTILDV